MRPLQRCWDCGAPRDTALQGKRRGTMVPLCRACKKAGAVPPPPVPPFLRQALKASVPGRARLRRLEARPRAGRGH